MSTALSTTQREKYTQTQALFADERFRQELAAGLPAHIGVEQFTRVALTTLRRNPTLLQCSRESLLAAMYSASSLGLKIDGLLGEAYLVPYKSECQLIPGYRGLIKLVRQSGQVKSLKTEIVRPPDEFEYQQGDDPYIRHKPDPDYDGSEWTHVYAVVHLMDGGIQRSVWTRKAILRHRDKYSPSKSRKDSPWQTAEEQMARKTVIRDMVARGELPVSVEVVRMVSAEERWEVQAAPPRRNRLADLTSEILTKETPALPDPTIPDEPVAVPPYVADFAACTSIQDLEAAKAEWETEVGEGQYDSLMDAYDDRHRELSQ